MKKKLNVTFELLTVKAALEAIKLGSKFRLNCVTKSILLMAIILVLAEQGRAMPARLNLSLNGIRAYWLQA